MKKKIILHIDFDSFFASVEQQYNPILRNRPIGVTAANGRTCIIAASREAKRYGIKTGTRSWEATRMYPGIIFVKADFVKYLEVSKKFISICKDYSPLVEVFSIDEVFMDATGTAHLFGGVDLMMEKIKKRLRDEVGECITASFGVSHNKLLAKLASGLNKPDGVFRINPENVIEVYKKVPLIEFCGIGTRIEARLNQMGIYSPIQLRLAPLRALIAEFGQVEGKFLKDLGMGIDLRPVVSYREVQEVKSVGRNYCLPKNEYNKKKVLQNIYELCEEVAIKLRRLGKKTRTVGISIRGDEDFFARKTVSRYFDTGKEIFEECMRACRYIQLSGSYVRQIGIWVSNLEDSKNLPSSLFEKERKIEKVTRVIDILNERFGDHTVRNGFLLYADKLTTVPNGYMADKYERLKLSQMSED